ncbi:MAG: hypothetical protein KA257_10485 [Opitutaceae bacterium]|nr:hypothetical protein [Opitutaceae bacterium]MBP9913487.1 hypothetical protein [Opitutaceae bacterium]
MENPNKPTVVTEQNKRFALGPALWAGVIASLVFQGLEILLIPLVGGGSPWGSARMIAAMVLGPGVLPPPATFDLKIVLVALAIDIVLAVIYAGALGWLTQAWRAGWAVLMAVILGAGLYGLNFYGFTAIFPWFESGRNGVTLFTHIVFSVTAVLAYKNLHGRSTLSR